MACNASDLRAKEVINICDCRKLGNVCDFEIDICDGKITAIFVPGECGFFSFSHQSPIRIRWCDIEKIGDDIILVNLPPESLSSCTCDPCKKGKKKGIFF